MESLSIDEQEAAEDTRVRTAFVRTVISYLSVLDKKNGLISEPLNVLRLHKLIVTVLFDSKSTSPQFHIYTELLRVINNSMYLFVDDAVIPLEEIKTTLEYLKKSKKE